MNEENRKESSDEFSIKLSDIKEDFNGLKDPATIITCIMVILLLIAAFFGGYYVAYDKVTTQCNKIISDNNKIYKTNMVIQNDKQTTVNYFNFT